MSLASVLRKRTKRARLRDQEAATREQTFAIWLSEPAMHAGSESRPGVEQAQGQSLPVQHAHAGTDSRFGEPASDDADESESAGAAAARRSTKGMVTV